MVSFQKNRCNGFARCTKLAIQDRGARTKRPKAINIKRTNRTLRAASIFLKTKMDKDSTTHAEEQMDWPEKHLKQAFLMLSLNKIIQTLAVTFFRYRAYNRQDKTVSLLKWVFIALGDRDV